MLAKWVYITDSHLFILLEINPSENENPKGN